MYASYCLEPMLLPRVHGYTLNVPKHLLSKANRLLIVRMVMSVKERTRGILRGNLRRLADAAG
jgi:hypothetical protein